MKELMDKINKESTSNNGKQQTPKSNGGNNKDDQGVVYMDDLLGNNGQKINFDSNEVSPSRDGDKRLNKISEEIESSSKDSKLVTNPASPKLLENKGIWFMSY